MLLSTGLGKVEEVGDPDGSGFDGGWGKNLIRVGSGGNRVSTIVSRSFA